MPELHSKLYPRGFFGRVLPPQFIPSKSKVQARMNQLQVRVSVVQPQVNTLDPNPEIEQYYRRWLGEGQTVNTFEFREQVLVSAIQAFGTESFHDWYMEQFRSPAFGDLHHRFLEDTLGFIESGTRSLSLQNWMAVINQTDDGANEQILGAKAAEFFGVPIPGHRYRQPQNRWLLPVMQRWLSHPQGFEDFLLTLRVLFGEL
jgi:hypothetical protein